MTHHLVLILQSMLTIKYTCQMHNARQMRYYKRINGGNGDRPLEVIFILTLFSIVWLKHSKRANSCPSNAHSISEYLAHHIDVCEQICEFMN